MSQSSAKNDFRERLSAPEIISGEIKAIAKEIKTDHDFALELWDSNDKNSRLLAVLILDKNQITEALIDTIAADLLEMDLEDRNMISEWLLANQLTKSKAIVSLLNSWEHRPSPVMRRLFWYYQARLRWTGNTAHDNTLDLLESIEANIAAELPEVQWAMNFTAAQIGIFSPELRSRCIKLGERVGLYQDEPVAKNCTPSYLPEFIRIQVSKQKIDSNPLERRSQNVRTALQAASRLQSRSKYLINTTWL
ncbi:MAG: DNA alkylation repair protein, partial [Leptospirales bacterium]